MEDSRKSQMESEERENLVDFLYKDNYRIDSYMAQLLDGAVRSVKQQENTLHGSSHSLSVFKYQYGKNNLTSALNEYNIDPHDHNVVILLSSLDLEPIYTAPPDECMGKLVHLQGSLSIRDFNLFNDLIPTFTKNASLLGQSAKEARKIKSIWEIIEKVAPMNIELECELADGAIIRGILKEDYLLTAYRDIMSLYGTTLPGIWNVIGLLDTPASNNRFSSAGIRSMMDNMAAAASTLYNDNNSIATIIPVLIYRELSK